MLQHVPAAPGWTSTTVIADALRAEGYDLTERTVQRDLVELTTKLPLHCDDQHGKPFRWSWTGKGTLFDLPGMDGHTALAFRLAEEMLAPLLPSASLKPLQRHFRRAREVLSRQRKLARWPEKVRVQGRGVPVLAPAVREEVLRCVQLALLEERRFRATYRRRGEQKTREYLVNPLALVVRDRLVYLVCTLERYDDPVLLLLHRMLAARPTEEARAVPRGFDLDRYLAGGALGFVLHAAPVRLVARFDRSAAPTVLEAPLSADQRSTDEPDGWVRVEATVHDSIELRMWLRSFGDEVEVLAPAELRAVVAASLRAALARYGDESPATAPARHEVPGLRAAPGPAPASRRARS